MRAFLISVLCFIALSPMAFCSGTANGKAAESPLASGFQNPPDSVRISCYWYWVSNNVSKEGVVKDLYAMKRAGIGRAYIGNIGLDDVPYGKVRMLTDEWWDILHTALKTATDLGIQIGIFNSPGWSQSGGPWVDAKSAMRYLTSSEIKVKGPMKLVTKLQKPTADFQDVRVIAYPEPKNDQLILNTSNSTITSVPELSGLDNVVDHNPETSVTYPSGKDLILNFTAKKPFTARYIYIRTANTPEKTVVELQARVGTDFKTIRVFNVERYNDALNVGFDPYAPVVETFPAVTAKEFRVILKNGDAKAGIAEVEIGAGARVERYAEKTFAKMLQTPQPYWHEYQWPVQAPLDDPKLVIDPASMVDISAKMSADGTLTWNVPAGEWIIERTGMTPTGTKNSPAAPEATGFEVDKMNKEHVAMHFDGHMGEVLRRIPEADRKSFKIVVLDSYEMGGQNFTDDFFERFEKEYGYSALPFLPVFSGKTVKSQDASDRFLWDMRRLVANMVATEYVGGLTEASHKHGLTTWLENYGHWGFPSESLIYGSYSDEISGEYWAEGDLGNIENRIATSCGHIYGKNKIYAESYTSAGNPFGRTPADIKQRGDRFFAEGINSSLLHVYITQPDDRVPGYNAWFGTEFERNNTWNSQLDLFTSYLKRVDYLLQQGNNVADIAYFIGEDAPKMTGITDPALPAGYQFDYMNYDIIMNRLFVKDGLLTLPQGTQYRLLVLPKLTTMRPELVAKIKDLVRNGAIVYGPAPDHSPSLKGYPEADVTVKKLAEELWGDVDGVTIKSHKYGKGMIINGMDLKEALAMVGSQPDCQVGPVAVNYGHRKAGNADIYFLTNQSAGQTVTVNPEFRVAGMQPELWLPTTGEIRPLPAYEQTATTTKVPLKLAPNESAFIVFRHAAGKAVSDDLSRNYPDPVTIAAIKGPWLVTFENTKFGPESPVKLDTLYDLSTSVVDKIKYYSGDMTYTAAFSIGKLMPGSDIVLNLSAVGNMAKVKINGQYAGGVWTPPYELNISKLVKKGKNTIEVQVVNTWVNRLLGDSKLPVEQRSTWTVHYPEPGVTLQKSGLIGPVTIQRVSR